MLDYVRIKNFKSIRDLDFSPRRVNIFIGEPNSGKSNILEALGFFSSGTFPAVNEVLRFRETSDLFYDQKISNSIHVQAGDEEVIVEYKHPDFQGRLLWRNKNDGPFQAVANFSFNHNGIMSFGGKIEGSKIRYYRFKNISNFKNGQLGVLSTPFGDNLATVLQTNENLNQGVKALFRSKGFRLQIKPSEKEILITKDVNDELYSYPWENISETLRRIVFYMGVLETNKDSTLLLDEPEANTFPFYTKYLAERIAQNESNQFLITTHNPYLLSSLIEKTQTKDLAVFVTAMENYETKLKPVSDAKLSEMLSLDADAFFNLERLTN